MILNLYTANHAYTEGIEDYVRLIREVVGRRGLKVQVSTELQPGVLNVVIDEFTNYRQNRKIADFKRQNPDTPLVLLLTEFFESKLGVASLNLFGGWCEVAAVALMNVYLRSIRRDFRPASAADYLRAAVAAPVILLAMVPDTLVFVAARLLGRQRENPVRRFLSRFHRSIYFHLRYLGLSACMEFADAIVTSHESIIKTVAHYVPAANGKPHLGILYPELNEREVLRKLMVGKALFIEFTGSLTPFRLRVKRRVDRAVLALAMHHEFQRCRTMKFAEKESGNGKERGAYSMHPPQTRRWPYSSPTRIYRALAVDCNLPVLTRNFGQSPIEDLCYVWKDRYSVVELAEMYSDRTRLLEFMEGRLEKYNAIARTHNERLTQALREIGKESVDERAKVKLQPEPRISVAAPLQPVH